MPSTPGTSLTTAWWHLGEAMGRFSQDKHIAKTQSLKLIYCFFWGKLLAVSRRWGVAVAVLKIQISLSPKKKHSTSSHVLKHFTLYLPETRHPFLFDLLTRTHTHTQRSLAGRTFWCPWPTLGVVACGWPRGIERRARAVPLSKLYIVAVQILSNTIQNDLFKTKSSQSTTWKQNHLQEHWISDRQIVSTAVMRMFQSLGFH